MPFFPSIPLQTERLLIRYLTNSDSQAIFKIRSDPEVMRYWSSPPIAGLVEGQKIIASSQKGYETGEFLQLGIERKSDTTLIGTCILFAFHRPSRRAEIGYALVRPYWGQGYMHEALIRLVQYAFGDLHLNLLEAAIDPRNTASANTGLYGLLQRDWTNRNETK